MFIRYLDQIVFRFLLYITTKLNYYCQMSCVQPCQTCNLPTFNSCLSCDTSTQPSLTLTNSLCLIEPNWIIQLACLCMLSLFFSFPLGRKRSMVLIKIGDIIQYLAYFKYLYGFVWFRETYLYLGMRSMNPWSEGWDLIKVENDQTLPIWIIEETHLNKLIRLGSQWIAILVILLIVSAIRSCCSSNLSFTSFFTKNISNTLCIIFNFTVMDMCLIISSVFMNPNFTNGVGIGLFIAAIVLSIIILVMVVYMTYAINFDYLQNKQHRLWNYEHMYLLRMDYDLFQTYSLTNLPKYQKKMHRYSNLVLIDVLRKIGFACYMTTYLYDNQGDLFDQLYHLLGFFIIFTFMFYIVMPFDPKNEILQLIISILADLVLFVLLVLLLIGNYSHWQTIYMILALSLYGLAILCIVIEGCLDIYKFIPFDLYGTGLTVVIEDKKLLRQIQQRKKEQLDNEKRLKELEEQNERLRQEKKQKKMNKQSERSKKSQRNQIKQKHQSQESLQKHTKANILIDENEDKDQFHYPVEKLAQTDEISKYKINMKKKRRVYDYDKNKAFMYSNKLDD